MDIPPPIEEARNPDSWIVRAEEFRVAAEVLAEQQELACRRVHESGGQEIDEALASEFGKAKLNLSCLLMMGYAIELLLKALIFQAKPDALRQNKRHDFQTHDLVILAKDAAFDVPDERTKAFITGLSASMYWGKYPSTHDEHANIIVDGDKYIRKLLFHPNSRYSLTALVVDQFLPFYRSIRDAYFQRRNEVAL